MKKNIVLLFIIISVVTYGQDLQSETIIWKGKVNRVVKNEIIYRLKENKIQEANEKIYN